MKPQGIFCGLCLFLLLTARALAAPGEVDPSLAPTFDRSATQLQLQPDGRMLLGGAFTTINGVPVSKIARINNESALEQSFAPFFSPGYPISFVLLPTGKILVAGSFTSVNSVTRVAVARLNSDGSVDDTWDLGWQPGVKPSGGPPPIPGAPDFVCKIEALWPNGDLILQTSVLAAGDGSPLPSIVKVSANGAIDTTFTLPVAHVIYRFWPLANGKLLAHYRDSVFLNGGTLIRCYSDGSQDPTFTPPALGFLLSAVVEQPDGKLLLIGDGPVSGGAGSIVRLGADGAIDQTFHATVSGQINSAAIAANGDVLIGGDFSLPGVAAHYTLARLLPTGAFDFGFRPATGGPYSVASVAIQSDGKILTVGQGRPVNGQYFVESVRRFMTDDPNSAGVFILPNTRFEVEEGKPAIVEVQRVSGASGTASVDLVLQSATANAGSDFDGATIHVDFAPGEKSKNAVVATHEDGGVEPVELFRLSLQNPSAGAAVGWRSGGEVRIIDNDGPASVVGSFHLLPEPAGATITALASLPDGSILIGGNFTRVQGHPRPGLAKLKADGALDLAFDPQLPNFSRDIMSGVQAMAVLPDGRIVAGGFFSATAPNQTLIRLRSDGSLDTPTPELLSVPMNVGFSGLIAQGSNLVVFTGGGDEPRSGVRLNAGGSLDSSFTTDTFWSVSRAAALSNGDLFAVGSIARRMTSDGVTIFEFWPGLLPSQGYIQGFAEAGDGKIILSGAFATLGKQGLVRITAAGAIDQSFAPDLNAFVGEWLGGGVAVQPNGKILATVVPYSGNNAYLVRLHETGAIDTTFEPVQFAGTSSQQALNQILVHSDATIFVGGRFEEVNETMNPALVRLKGGEENLQRPLLMRSLQVEAESGAVVVLSVQPFKEFAVERSSDLNAWETISVHTSPTARFEFEDATAKDSQRYFYRTRLLGP